MIEPGTLLWVSIKPLFQMGITTAFGFLLTKFDLFGGIAARGAGQIVINITIPSLLFSKIVPSFTSQNINALGPLILIGLIYELLGFVLAFLVRQFFWVPHRFRYGILAAGTWGNWADIPTAVVMSITSSAPFNGQSDSDIAVAYVAVFILIFYTTLFPMGGHLLIAKDFKGPDYSDDEVRMTFMEKVWQTRKDIAHFFKAVHTRVRRPPTPTTVDLEKIVPSNRPSSELSEKNVSAIPDAHVNIAMPQPRVAKSVSWDPEIDLSRTTDLDGYQTPSRVTNDAQTTLADGISTGDAEGMTKVGLELARVSRHSSPPPQHDPPVWRRIFHRFVQVIKTFSTPPAIAICISFPIALIPRLKGLFVQLPNSPLGPDHQPALSFVMDTATFIGAASVPLGLICLGSALARLKIPRPFTMLPLGAISMFTLCKLFILPVFGVLICQLFTYKIRLIRADDKVLRYVCIFFSSVPTATAQVYITQLHSPDGDAAHLSAFLVPQYVLLIISMTSLNAFTLSMLFG